MSQQEPDYSEDEQILSCLSDPMDVEAFSNLMEHAHGQGMSAADFVREEPKRTSRGAIRKLCLKDHKRSLWVQIASTFKNMWERPAEDPERAFIHALYGPPARPQNGDTNGHTGRN